MAHQSWNKIASDAQGQQLDYQLQYKTLSFIGKYLTLQQDDYCDCGGAHPSAFEEFKTIDLAKSTSRKQQPVMLSDLFPEAVLLGALEGDKVVRSYLETTKAPLPVTLGELMGVLKFQTFPVGECDFNFGDNLLSHFAFYDVQDNMVAIRIGLSHGSEVCRGQLTQLSLLLPVPERLRADLTAAKERNAGLLMVDAKDRKPVDFNFLTRGSLGRRRKRQSLLDADV